MRTDASRKRVAVDIRVKAPWGRPKPDGAITVSIGKRTVEAQVVGGSARVVVRGAKAGTRPVVVSYAGTDLVQPAVARRASTSRASPQNTVQSEYVVNASSAASPAADALTARARGSTRTRPRGRG